MRIFTRWDEELSTGETDEFLTELALAHAEQIQDIATRERVVASLTSDVLYSLCDFDFHYERWSPLDAYHVRQCCAFFSKRADIELGIDKRAAALAKFKESEVLCGQTNNLFKAHAAGRFQFPPHVESVIHTAQRKIARILGDVPSLSDLKYRFGPGATTQVKKSSASARNKLSQQYCCSEDLLPMVSKVIEEMPSWIEESRPTFVEWSDPLFEDQDSVLVDVVLHDARLGFVPKTAKIDRGICVEPSLNSMVQLGIGDWMTNRLAQSGIDLRDQSRNQRLAREGSITGALATLDLSSASDTIATELVAALLPLDWFLLLQRARSGYAEFDGVRYRLEKFSSMGNGFTFPLESLIFYALAWSSTDQAERSSVSVYGDDIIVPVKNDALTRKVLHCCGFVVNASKSFSTGPFRESCGKDYLQGIDIRPIYVKNRLSGADAFVLHNYYVRTLQPELASAVLRRISEPLQKWGPDGYGDGHLIGDWNPIPHKRDRGWAGYTFETYSWKGRKQFRSLPGDYVYPFYTIYASPPRAGLPGLFQGRPPLDRMRELCHEHRRTTSYYNSSTVSQLHRKGLPGDILPGRKGYKLISIYTLAS